MKFKSIPKTDLVVSEIGFDLSRAARSTPGTLDATALEPLIRHAYDHGINFFLIPGAVSADAARLFHQAFAPETRSKLVFGFSVASDTPLEGPDLVTHCENFLRDFDLSAIDILQLGPTTSGCTPACLEAADRLRRRGAVRSIGLRGNAEVNRPDQFRDLWDPALIGSVQIPHNLLNQAAFDRWSESFEHHALETGAGLFIDSPLAEGLLAGPMREAWVESEDRFIDLAPWRARAEGESDRLCFLWEETGRTRAQAAILYCLRKPWALSVFPDFTSESDIAEYCAALLSPPLTDEEIRTAESVWKSEIEPRLSEIAAPNYVTLGRHR